MKVRELFSDESKWTQFTTARDQYSRPVPIGKEFVSYCLLGAVYRCYQGEKYQRVFNTVCAKLAPILVTEWNDNPKRTFAEVKQLVEELDI